MDLRTITENLRKDYFWDIDLSASKEVPERLIIERVFNFGTLRDAVFIINYYGREKVEQTLLRLNYIDPKTLKFISVIFEKPITVFRCYTRKQSIPRFWNY